ncbi:MAG: hypothetical protein ACKOX2_05045 [Microcystaceae cyanobacterium]
MENIIILTALYILIIGILYAPKYPAQTATETPIDYFPDVEETPEPVTVNSSSESLESAIAALSNPSEPLPIVADESIVVTDSPDLKSLSIRRLGDRPWLNFLITDVTLCLGNFNDCHHFIP